jgi:hypothetical protein
MIPLPASTYDMDSLDMERVSGIDMQPVKHGKIGCMILGWHLRRHHKNVI